MILAGCASDSSALLSLYLISLRYGNFSASKSTSLANPDIVDMFSGTLVNGSTLEVRTGYFTVCVKHADSTWECRRDAASLVQHVRPDQDPLNLVWQSQKFKDDIVFYPLMSVF